MVAVVAQERELPTSTAKLTPLMSSVQEVVRCAGCVDPEAIEAAATKISTARRVFVLGAGRSGVALQSVAMRLMHLGFDAHVIGEVTAPAVGRNDVILVASASGATDSVVRAADKAVGFGASVVVITVDTTSSISRLGEVVIEIPAPTKMRTSSTLSTQYAGSLFEQMVMLVGDSLFALLWGRSGKTAEDLWRNHANLE